MGLIGLGAQSSLLGFSETQLGSRLSRSKSLQVSGRTFPRSQDSIQLVPWGPRAPHGGPLTHLSFRRHGSALELLRSIACLALPLCQRCRRARCCPIPTSRWSWNLSWVQLCFLLGPSWPSPCTLTAPPRFPQSVRYSPSEGGSFCERRHVSWAWAPRLLRCIKCHGFNVTCPQEFYEADFWMFKVLTFSPLWLKGGKPTFAALRGSSSVFLISVAERPCEPMMSLVTMIGMWPRSQDVCDFLTIVPSVVKKSVHGFPFWWCFNFC